MENLNSASWNERGIGERRNIKSRGFRERLKGNEICVESHV